MSKFTPSPQEVALVNQIFAQADTQKIGVVTGEAAVKIFSGTKLPPSTLAEIWSLADEDNKGVLTRKDVAVAIRLLGHAQRGERVTEAHIHQPGPPPSIEGLNSPLSQQWTGTPSAKSPPPGPAAGLPPLTPQDKAKFQKLFLGCGPTNGLLAGDKAREVFVKSKLPVEKLGQIWTLADMKSRGALDLADFTIAMYLIQASMSGALPNIPPVLPPYIYEQARPGVDGVATHATGGSGSFSPTSGGFPGRPASMIQPQHTGTGILQPQITGQRSAPPLPTRAPVVPLFPLAPQATGHQVPWDVTPQEKATFDQFFDTLDTQKRGFIEGDVAVPFMLQSKLSDDVLAQIWDLADYNNDGRLTRDGFAVAMHLIQRKLAGKEVPSTLPSTLVPPSVRGQIAAAPAPAQSAQSAVPEAIRDLLWDDTPPSSATIPQRPAVPAFPPPRASTTSPKPAQSPASNLFGASDPFATSSSLFVIPQASGQAPAPALAPVGNKDLLSDDEEPVAASPPLQDKSAEVGNVQNQLHSTNRALETSKREREDLEKRIAEQAAQLSALQTQLSSAKASYETETRLLATLRERFSTQSTDIQKTRQELIHAESDLSAVRVEKAEVEGSLLRDKEEVRELQRKMAEVGAEVESLKAHLEKAKKEAKQQKGLLAIAKKQLVSREAERSKIAKELEEAQADVDTTSKELQEAEAELEKSQSIPIPERVASPSGDSITTFAAAHPLPASPEPGLASPTLSVISGKSTNPFERLTMGGAGSPRSQSPFLPFTGSTILPTLPTGAPAPASEQPSTDPFGFDDAFGNGAGPSDDQSPTADTMTTPSTSQNGSLFGAAETSGVEADVLSPTDTENFVTPPTTATMQTETNNTEKAREASPAPASAASPAVEQSIPGYFPPVEAQPEEKHEQTDLSTQLRDIEVEESDSDSADDEPLTNVKAKLEHQAPATSTSQAGPSSSAFDDSFDISSSQPAAAMTAPSTSSSMQSSGSQETPKASISSPFPAPPAPVENVTSTNSESSAAGVSDFDEALGKLSGGSGASQFSHVSQFTFDSAFEDDFDFAAAQAASGSEAAPQGASAPVPAAISAFPPAPAQAPKVEGFDAIFLPQVGTSATLQPSAPTPTSAPVQAESSRPFSFDDVFGATPSAPANGAAAPAIQQVPSDGPQGFSFDDAFGGHTTAPAQSSLSAFGNFGATQHQSQPSSDGSHPTSQTSTPFPTSIPSSPVRETTGSISGSANSRRSLSPPPRELSPPPRLASKSRPSTAGSADKEKPTRTSKLSIRLPFGRKKNKHDPMPSHLSQSLLVEEPPVGGATPAAEDDIDAVKTLCSMGFSRTQAVTALEQYDYDVQRALNSLLGTR